MLGVTTLTLQQVQIVIGLGGFFKLAESQPGRLAWLGARPARPPFGEAVALFLPGCPMFRRAICAATCLWVKCFSPKMLRRNRSTIEGGGGA